MEEETKHGYMMHSRTTVSQFIISVGLVSGTSTLYHTDLCLLPSGDWGDLILVFE